MKLIVILDNFQNICSFVIFYADDFIIFKICINFAIIYHFEHIRLGAQNNHYRGRFSTGNLYLHEKLNYIYVYLL